MLLDGLGDITHQKYAVDAIKHLGYPEYAVIILGISNILGQAAILQPRFTTLKEWAYAGFAIHFIMAALSRYLFGDPTGTLIPPLLLLLFMLYGYGLWKKIQRFDVR
jgi:uncharacterized membrane protein